MTIGDNIKKYRKKNKISQAKLSEMIGKSKSSIEKYESNKVVPSILVLENIASALNITINDLTNQNNHGLYAHVKSKQAFKGCTYKPINNEFIQLDINDPNDMDMLINNHISNISDDELLTFKNKKKFKNELDNQILLYDKMTPKELELLYISKINDLKSIMESQERMIKNLENMIETQNNMIDILRGGNNGE